MAMLLCEQVSISSGNAAKRLVAWENPATESRW
jgi:hypothetical protein